MKTSYVRPADLTSAAKIFSPNTTLPVYGYHSEPVIREGMTIIDLQDCALGGINSTENTLTIGASVCLQSVMENPACPPALRAAIQLEDQLNRRNMLTLMDSILGCDGTSPLVTVLLSMDVKLNTAEGDTFTLADFLPFREAKLFTSIELSTSSITVYKTVNATPADRPLVGAALTKWDSGRVRLVLGGSGKAPIMVVDGKGSHGIENAAASAYLDAGDHKATKEYRSAMAKTLTLRCITELANVI